MNRVYIIGRLCADPELKMTNGGKSVTTFTIAVNREWQKSESDFLDCVAWEKTAEFICKYFQKGAPIVIEGAIQTRTYEDKNGQKRKAVEISVKNVEFVPKNAGANAEGREASFGARADVFLTPAEESAVQSRTAAYGNTEDFTEVYDEDLPF